MRDRLDLAEQPRDVRLWQRTVFVLAMALGPVCLSGQGFNGGDGKRELAAGIAAMRAGKIAEAQVELQKSLRLAPKNAEAHLQLGLLLGQSGDVQGAGEAFRKAVRARPDWAEAHYNLGLALVADAGAKRDWEGAMAEFREAIRLRPGYADAHRLLGVGLAESGEGEAALAELRAAVAVDPNSAESRMELGRVLESGGDARAAEHEYRAAVRLRAGYADGEIALGKLLLKRDGGAQEAIAHLREALRADPDLAAAQYSLGKAFQKSGDPAQAEIALREAAALTKRQEEAVQCTRLSNEGLDAAHRGQIEIAVKDLREAVELRPDSAIAHYNLGLVLADKGEIAPGREQIVEAISLMPTDARFYVALGRMWDPAAAHAAKGDPFEYGAATDTPDAHYAFATVLAQRGDWVGAAGEWLRVLAERPNDVEARNNLGVSYAHAGKDDLAELEFRKALQVSADSAGAHFGLAILDLQRGDKRQAMQELREVVRVKPDYPQAQSLLIKAAE